MYELIQLTEHDYYIDCPARIGLVLTGENQAVLIDSGSDKDAARKVLKHLEIRKWQLTAIFNTHSHADHIGGNRLLQDRTGCAVYARGLECAYTQHPELESMGLYGGLPFRELRNKFLLAQESRPLPLTEDVLPRGMQLLDLPGHCFEMTGFLTADGTAYIADCISSPETLAKYGIGYLWDPAAAVSTLEKLETISAARFVPAHASVTEDIRPAAQENHAAILETEERICSLCAAPISFEKLLKAVFDSYGLTMTAQQYVLIGSTVRSYLSSLYTRGRLTFTFAGNEMLWQQAATEY